MTQQSLTISKTDVYNEVAKTTSYGGKKMQDDDSAYDRMHTTPEDEEMLSRFWEEGCDLVTDILRPFLTTVTDTTDYTVTLDMPSRYDTTLNPMLKSTVFNFITTVIIAKWYEISNKTEAEKYAATADALARKIRSTIFHRKKPTLIQQQEP